MSKKLDALLAPALQQRREQHLYRQRRTVEGKQGVEFRIDGNTMLSFCSNDYLGLAGSPELANTLSKAADQFACGSGAAHLITGHHIEHQRLEEELAEFTQRPRALLFSTGYMANMGTINALSTPDTLIAHDALNHASLLDGGWLSRGVSKRYTHADIESANTVLSSSACARKLLVTDGVFSMDGDLAPLPELAATAQQHDAFVMVDDAHGIGVLGQHGGGICEHYHLGVDDVPILMGTLGKGFGSFGAFVAGSETLIESLIQFGRTYIYTTALPAAVASATRAALELVKHGEHRREHLGTLIAHFRQQAKQLGLPLMASDTPIQPLLIGDAAVALSVAAALNDEGILITPIRPPTVPVATARLRITFSASHSLQHIDRLITALDKAIPTELRS